MSVAEQVTAPGGRTEWAVRARRGPSTRLYRSELALLFGRRRNQAILAVLALVPVVIAVAVKIAAPESNEGPPFLAAITGNGIFVAFTALTVIIPLFLPVAVSMVAGDAVAGEAGTGTLRYLLTVPVSRGRLLAMKYAGIVTYAVAAALLVAGVGLGIGLLLFGAGDVPLLSGSSVPLASALWRLVLVALYVAASMAVLGAIGLFVSTLTESALAATAATVVLSITSQVLDTVPQLSAVHPYLFSHWWFAFGDLLRTPVATDDVARGLLTALAYVAVFGTAAWARFAGKDVSS